MQKIVGGVSGPEGGTDPTGATMARDTLDTAYGVLDAQLADRRWSWGATPSPSRTAPPPRCSSTCVPSTAGCSRTSRYYRDLVARPSFVRELIEEALSVSSSFPLPWPEDLYYLTFSKYADVVSSDKPVARMLRRLGGVLASWCLQKGRRVGRRSRRFVFKRTDDRPSDSPKVGRRRRTLRGPFGPCRGGQRQAPLAFERRSPRPHDGLVHQVPQRLCVEPAARGAAVRRRRRERGVDRGRGEFRLDGVLPPDVLVAAGSSPSASMAASGASIPDGCGCPAPPRSRRDGLNATYTIALFERAPCQKDAQRSKSKLMARKYVRPS